MLRITDTIKVIKVMAELIAIALIANIGTIAVIGSILFEGSK